MFFAHTVAPLILYCCSAVLAFMGIRRMRAGSPIKGLFDIAGAVAFTVIGWSMANP